MGNAFPILTTVATGANAFVTYTQQGRIDDQQGRTDSMERSISAIATNLDSLMAEVEGNKVKIQQQIVASEASADLPTDLTPLTEELAAQHNRIDEQQKDLDSLKSLTSTTSTDLTSLTAEVAAQKVIIDDQKTTLDSLETTTSTTSTDLAALTQRVADLEALHASSTAESNIVISLECLTFYIFQSMV